MDPNDGYMKEKIWHLRRHLAAREPCFLGKETVVPNTSDSSFIGNGVHPDGKAHLCADQYILAEEIGKTFFFPKVCTKMYLGSSDLVRADETARHLFVGMAKNYAEMVLGIDVHRTFTDNEKKILSENGLHRHVKMQGILGLREVEYKNSKGELDNGDELVSEAYNNRINPTYTGYAWMVQKGFENDFRSEHPQKVFERGIYEPLRILLVQDYDVLLSVSHQWNLEAITAGFVGNLGKEGNELFNNAGGEYNLGGGFELRLFSDGNKVVDASLRRTTIDAQKIDQELPVNMDLLRKFHF